MTKAEQIDIPESDRPEDGRRARGQENRRKIVAAMLELIGGGAIVPSAEEVASRAQVGLRTVFRHFDDMESLYRELSSVMFAELMPIATAPLPQGDWRVRLGELIERRAKVFEKMMPYKNAADVHRHRSDYLRDEHARLGVFQRATLINALGEKLAIEGPRLEALDLLFSFDVWRHMRQEQKLDVDQCKALLTLTTHSLLASEVD
jgi:AcrR family transcriptional regulator